MNGLRTMRIKDVRIIVDEDTYNEMRGQKLSVTKTGSVYWHGAYKKHPLGKVITHTMFEPNLVVRHINGNKADFRYDNLEIVSKGEIMRRAGIPFTPKEEDEEEEKNKGKIK
jgi:hypothetical protein